MRRKYVLLVAQPSSSPRRVRHPSDLVYTIVPPLLIVLHFCLILASPFRLLFLLSCPFFFLTVCPLQGKPLHSSKAVDRARAPTRFWNKDDLMLRTMLTDERGTGPVVRTMLGRKTVGKKQWAPISIYLDLWGFYRCFFFSMSFLSLFLYSVSVSWFLSRSIAEITL